MKFLFSGLVMSPVNQLRAIIIKRLSGIKYIQILRFPLLTYQNSPIISDLGWMRLPRIHSVSKKQAAQPTISDFFCLLDAV